MDHDLIVIDSKKAIKNYSRRYRVIQAAIQIMNAKALAEDKAAGRSALAASMMQPIRGNLDYQGIARKCLVIQPLPQGALPVYQENSSKQLEEIVKPPYFHDAIIITSRKAIGQPKGIFGSRINIPSFQVCFHLCIRHILQNLLVYYLF